MRGAVLLGDRCHVHDGGRRRPQRDAPEARTHNARLVVLAHGAEYDEKGEQDRQQDLEDHGHEDEQEDPLQLPGSVQIEKDHPEDS